MSRFFRITLLLLAALLLTACAHSAAKMQVLDNSLRAYERAVRWSEWQTLQHFYKTDTRAVLAATQRAPDTFKVTGYDVLRRQLSRDENGLMQAVRITYYRTDDMIERHIIDTQEWRYDPGANLWFLSSPPPALK